MHQNAFENKTFTFPTPILIVHSDRPFHRKRNSCRSLFTENILKTDLERSNTTNIHTLFPLWFQFSIPMNRFECVLRVCVLRVFCSVCCECSAMCVASVLQCVLRVFCSVCRVCSAVYVACVLQSVSQHASPSNEPFGVVSSQKQAFDIYYIEWL